MRRYAALYPEETAGIVLVDPRHEAEGATWQSLSDASWEGYWTRKKSFYGRLPEAHRAEFDAFAAVIDSGVIPGLGGPFEIPTVVITAARPPDSARWVGESLPGRKARLGLHRTLVPDMGTHIVADRSGSYVHQEDPEMVLQAVMGIIAEVQSPHE